MVHPISDPTPHHPGPEEFRTAAREWLSSVAPRRAVGDGGPSWGEGDESVAVFDSWTLAEERRRVAEARAWEQQRFDAGWGALSWPEAHGGRDLPQSYEILYAAEEAGFAVPYRYELFNTTQNLIAPTVAQWGTPPQVDRFVRAMLRTDVLCCQLFSEPEAGSDLANVGTRAERDGDDWVIHGQKVWTSNAHTSEYGMAVCRTGWEYGKHAGITTFLVPMDAPGVDARPIRQMTGGSSFSEVFLDGVRIPDELRLGPVGSGWKVTLTTLAAERSSSVSLGVAPVSRVLDLARHLGRTGEPAVRQALADLWLRDRVRTINDERVKAALVASADPGPGGSIGKLMSTQAMRRTSDVVGLLLGPALVADRGEWGTYAWAEQVLGAPGYRIAGGSDEVQRNIIGERVLGLPREPRPTPGGAP